ncbi:hypothetical protein V5O48_017339 [Marasmius crinis-equi]|uniref:Ricin B lectin domain-containing protein n=1 Tax=Marasmius crinis-equi TaxID=585013 RepID=A0ABR3EPE4_9AGAR
MRSAASLALRLSAFVTVATAWQIESLNSAFKTAGRQGCIFASSNTTGAPVVIEDCNTDFSREDWDYTPFVTVNSGPQPLRILGDKCLDVTNGINADGTKLQIWTCVDQSPNQLWVSVTDFTFQWAGTNKCIDLTDGNVNPGNQLQIWTCDPNNSNQIWSNPFVPLPPPPGAGVRLLASGGPQHVTSQCLTAASNADGARVALTACTDPTTTFPNGNSTWVLPTSGAVGQIKTFDGTKCLDVPNGNAMNGNPLQIWSCIDGNTNQLWNVGIEGPQGPASRLLSWAGQTQCVDVKDGNFTAGNDLQIWTCDSNNVNQWWNAF